MGITNVSIYKPYMADDVEVGGLCLQVSFNIYDAEIRDYGDGTIDVIDYMLEDIEFFDEVTYELVPQHEKHTDFAGFIPFTDTPQEDVVKAIKAGHDTELREIIGRKYFEEEEK